MNEISGAGNASTGGIRGANEARTPAARPVKDSGTSQLTKSSGDDVKVSAEALALSKLNGLEEVRIGRVNEVRQALEDPNYVDQRFEEALGLLLGDFS